MGYTDDKYTELEAGNPMKKHLKPKPLHAWKKIYTQHTF